MKARRLIIAGMWLNLLAASATAETIVIRPDPCAAPADAPKIVLMGGVEAADLKPDRAAADPSSKCGVCPRALSPTGSN